MDYFDNMRYTKEVFMAGRKEMDLTTGRPFGALFKFAIPVILGNLFQLFIHWRIL